MTTDVTQPRSPRVATPPPNFAGTGDLPPGPEDFAGFLVRAKVRRDTNTTGLAAAWGLNESSLRNWVPRPDRPRYTSPQFNDLLPLVRSPRRFTDADVLDVLTTLAAGRYLLLLVPAAPSDPARPVDVEDRADQVVGLAAAWARACHVWARGGVIGEAAAADLAAGWETIQVAGVEAVRLARCCAARVAAAAERNGR